MAITNLNLNVRANTARALRDFKRFSDTLDNKFLVSGLKLDVIRSSLSQINREFQRSIGEQGLASASSLRAAQNQAALLTQTFKGFASESALAINRDIGTALNSLAVRAGGTMKDVQKTLSAASFVSIKMPEGQREQLLKDMMSLQRDMRRAGVSENFGGIAQQFLSGRVQAMDLIGSEDAGAAFIGAEILKRSGGRAQVTDPRQRSQILAEVVSDPAIINQFKEMARRTMGYRLVLEDLNTKLFNPEMGLFGSLRKVLGADGRYTTMFDQVEVLANTVFGPNGPFATFFKRIGEVFNIGDPMQPFIGLVQFSTKVANDINTFLQGDTFGKILGAVKGLFDTVLGFINGPTFQGIITDIKRIFKDLGDYLESERFAELSASVKETFGKVFEFLKGVVGTFVDFVKEIGTGSFEPTEIKESIKEIGESIRTFIKDVGKSIRDYDLDKAGGEKEFFAEIAGTLFSELGKTTVVLFKELFATLLDKIPEVAALVLPQINNGINSMLTEMFGELGGKIAKFVLGFVPGPVGMIARASAAGDITGGGGNMGSMLAMGAASFLGPSMLRRLTTQQGRFDSLSRIGNWIGAREDWVNRRLRTVDPVTGQNRLRPGTGLFSFLTKRLTPRSRRPEPEIEDLFINGVFKPPGWWRGGFIEPEGTIPAAYLNRVRAGGGGSGPNPPEGGGGSRRRRFWPFGGGGGGGGGRRFWPFGGGGGGRRFWPFGGGGGGVSNQIEGDRPVPRRLRGRISYSSPIGPMPIGSSEPWAPSEGVGYKGGGYDPRLESSYIEPTFEERLEDVRIKSRENKARQEEVNRRFRRRYGIRGRMGRMMPRFRGGGLLGVGLTAGAVVGMDLFRGSKAEETLGAGIQKVSENKGFGEVFGGISQGAAIGGAIGTVVPVIGNVAGAVIGGVIGGVMPLLNKETRESIGQLFSGLRSTFTTTITNLSTGFNSWLNSTWRYFTEGTKENFRKAQDLLGSSLRSVANGLISVFNGILTTFQLIPRLVLGMVEKIPGADKLPGFEAAKNAANFQIPTIKNNYGGKDFYGPAMALEARMSGRKPMVVNDGEFVIPAGSGMATLTNLVGQNLQSTGVLRQNQSREIAVSVQLVINNSAFVSDADELANKLRAPVHQIINEAWTKVMQTVPYRPA